MAIDTIATPTRVTADGSFMGKTLWTVTGTDSDVSTAIDIVAAPGVGKALYITGVILQGAYDADAFPQLQDGDGTLLFGPWISGTLTINTITWKFDNPIRLASNKALALKAGAAGSVYVYVEGFTATG